MLINRVGDIGLVLAMLLCLIEFGTLDFSAISGLLVTPNINRENVTIICLLLFWGGSREIRPIRITYLAS